MDIAARVRQLRICLAHHSYIYYVIGSSVIADGEWDSWASELEYLQSTHGEEWDPKYDAWFKEWDGTTGFLICDIPGLECQVKKTNPELFEQKEKTIGTELTENEILMKQYAEDREEKAEEQKARKAKKISRRQRRGNRHPWDARGADE